jgi:hypothetical protein
VDAGERSGDPYPNGIGRRKARPAFYTVEEVAEVPMARL